GNVPIARLAPLREVAPACVSLSCEGNRSKSSQVEAAEADRSFHWALELRLARLRARKVSMWIANASGAMNPGISPNGKSTKARFGTSVWRKFSGPGGLSTERAATWKSERNRSTFQPNAIRRPMVHRADIYEDIAELS